VKLGTLLLRDAVVTLSQLEAALRAQVIYGGRLGTNLVELGFLDVDSLGSYLARILEIPLATKDFFENVSSEALNALGPGLADVYTAVPLGVEGEGPARTLQVALAEPRNTAILGKLKVQTGLEIRAFCAPELRLHYYLEKHYNLSRRARFVRSSGPASRETGGHERRRSQPSAPPPEFVVSPTRPDTDKEFAAPESTPDPRYGFEDLCKRVQGARSRESIGETIMDFAMGRFGAAVLFLIRDQSAIGWRVYSETGISMEDTVEELSLPLGGSSALQIAADTGEVYRGPATSAGKPVERRLWEALGLETEPVEQMVAPICVDNRAVNLLYVSGLGGRRLVEGHATEAAELGRVASSSYQRLVKASKIR